MRLVKFQDNEGYVHYGIRYDETIVCGCCGSGFEIDEVTVLDERYVSMEEIIKEEMED